ncbi:hypothetical protein MAPG_09038 [Magnaporthiopsis poae ATCC 64411]|uniref:Uncharacterized protein n=1 Tax=Magnaporthiopsis poae (strain ATCC 64411 / 73-15) TaxID=644358 RepID=A0A0C4E8W8_MAGP6|nr:hypothetical protein MAPG_09038 [Magnaporthiopsis poae ATCC 64411]
MTPRTDPSGSRQEPLHLVRRVHIRHVRTVFCKHPQAPGPRSRPSLACLLSPFLPVLVPGHSRGRTSKTVGQQAGKKKRGELFVASSMYCNVTQRCIDLQRLVSSNH